MGWRRRRERSASTLRVATDCARPGSPGLRTALAAAWLGLFAMPAWAQDSGSGPEIDLAPARLATQLDMGWDQGPWFRLQRRHTLPGFGPDREWHLDEFRLEGRFGLKLGVDGAGYVSSSAIDELDSTANVRFARLALSGSFTWLRELRYKFEGDYATGEWILRSAWVQSQPLRWIGRIRVGQQDVPFSMSNLTGIADRTFMETAAVVQALAPPMRGGLTVGRPVLDERMTWALGVFTEGSNQDIGDASDSLLRFAGRMTGLPVYEERAHGPRLLHLGASTSFVTSTGEDVRYRSRPESYLASFVVDTGDLEADAALLAGLELAWQEGPFSVEGEWLQTWLRGDVGGDESLGGFYAGVALTLTGESRPYDRASGYFGRLHPQAPFRFGAPGWGALEVAGRVSWVDLDDGDVSGGRMGIATGALSWYPTDALRLTVEGAVGRIRGRESGNGAFAFAQARVQLVY